MPQALPCHEPGSSAAAPYLHPPPHVQVWNDTREDAETAEADIVKGHPGVRFYARCALAAGPNQEGNECIGFL